MIYNITYKKMIHKYRYGLQPTATSNNMSALFVLLVIPHYLLLLVFSLAFEMYFTNES